MTDTNTQEQSSTISDADPLADAIDELERSIGDKEVVPNPSKLNQNLFDVPVEVQVIVGTVEMTVSELMALQKNTVITLNSKIGDPVIIAVNGKRIGTGELEASAVDPDALCIRVTKLGD